MKQDIDFIDNCILNAIEEHPIMNDLQLSLTLQCPRTFLLSHLDKLIDYGHIIRNGELLSLSRSGKSIVIPMYLGASNQIATDFISTNFDWQIPYIPPIGWEEE